MENEHDEDDDGRRRLALTAAVRLIDKVISSGLRAHLSSERPHKRGHCLPLANRLFPVANHQNSCKQARV